MQCVQTQNQSEGTPAESVFPPANRSAALPLSAIVSGRTSSPADTVGTYCTINQALNIYSTIYVFIYSIPFLKELNIENKNILLISKY